MLEKYLHHGIVELISKQSFNGPHNINASHELSIQIVCCKVEEGKKERERERRERGRERERGTEAQRHRGRDIKLTGGMKTTVKKKT